MAFTEFYCRTGGSNLNAGSTTDTAAIFTFTGGNWVASTGIFTAAGADLSGVSVGMFASVYIDGATVGVFVGRITAVDDGADTITVSLTAKSGTAPTDGTGTRSIKVGGAWKGPNAAENFPMGFVTRDLTNASGDYVRVNLMNTDGAFTMTGAITDNNAGPVDYEGCTSAAGDGGYATIQGTTTGASYIPISSSGANRHWKRIFWKNNGSTGSANGSAFNGTGQIIEDCRFSLMVGSGLHFSGRNVKAIKCEAHGNNSSNTANKAGFSTTDGGDWIRCISHNNTGSNTSGWFLTFSVTGQVLENCVSDTNGLHGVMCSAGSMRYDFRNFAVYNNGSSGIAAGVGQTDLVINAENCVFESNGAYGVDNGGTRSKSNLRNCAFFSNTSGQVNGAKDESSTVTLTASSMADPANGDFIPATAEVKGAGISTFLQDANSYSGTTLGYPDIGVSQHQEVEGDSSLPPTKTKYNEGFN